MVAQLRLMNNKPNPYDGIADYELDGLAKARGMSAGALAKTVIDPALKTADTLWDKLSSASLD